jgi:hypothetical protein
MNGPAEGPAKAPVERDEIVARLAAFPDRLREAAVAAADRPVPPGEWTPAEVVRHLMAVEGEVWLARLATLVAGGEPRWSWTEPDPLRGFEDAPLEEVLGYFGRLRASTLDFLRLFDGDGWARTGVHETYGRLDVAGLLRLAIDHDEEHLMGLAAE